MEMLEQIAEKIREQFDAKTAARDQALSQARSLTRCCSQAIRAVHRDDEEGMRVQLGEADQLASALKNAVANFPDLYFAGYTQDALKEYVEANATCALIKGAELPEPSVLGVETNTYLNGLAEVIGELRRRCLDILRNGYSTEAERLLTQMDDIYAILVTMDYPDAITNGLRRQTDIARSIIEKTRGDITFSIRGEHLEKALSTLSNQLTGSEGRSGPTLSRAYERQQDED